eukprot:scaffold28014_cov106-Isochrysis_galbana.AAC.1
MNHRGSSPGSSISQHCASARAAGGARRPASESVHTARELVHARKSHSVRMAALGRCRCVWCVVSGVFVFVFCAHIILNTPLDKLLAPINKNNAETTSLRDFWKEAIKDLRELELKRRQTSPLGAESQPLWNNTLEDVQPNPKFRAVWQTLSTVQVQVAHLTNDNYER